MGTKGGQSHPGRRAANLTTVADIAGLLPGILPHHANAAAAGNRVDLYIGTDANWWLGLILIGVAIGLFAWALLRPVRAEPHQSDESA